MQADVTRQSFGSVVAQFVLLVALFWGCAFYGGTESVLPGFIHTHPAVTGLSDGYLPGNYINSFSSQFPFGTVVFSLLLIFINAFLITKIVSKNLVYPSRTYLSCIFYLLVACGICFPAYDLAAVLAAYLLVCASIAFISSFVRTASFGTTFRGAFLVGLTPLLEPQNAVYMLLVPVAMLIFRRGGRETMVAVLGSLFPALFAAYIWWAFDGNFTGIFIEIWQELTSGIPAKFTSDAIHQGTVGFTAFISTPAGILKMSGIALVAITLIASVFSFFTMSSDMRTRAYKINVFAVWFLFLAIVSISLPSRTCGNFLVLAIPAAFIAPSFFVKYRTVIPAILYILLIALIALANIFPLIA